MPINARTTVGHSLYFSSINKLFLCFTLHQSMSMVSNSFSNAKYSDLYTIKSYGKAKGFTTEGITLLWVMSSVQREELKKQLKDNFFKKLEEFFKKSFLRWRRTSRNWYLLQMLIQTAD